MLGGLEKGAQSILIVHLFFKQRLKRVLGVHNGCIAGCRHYSPFFLIFHIPCGGLVHKVYNTLKNYKGVVKEGVYEEIMQIYSRFTASSADE